jgi:AcrR family transcriptional regulator
VPIDELIRNDADSFSTIRVTPAQARSAERLTTLLDAAGAIVDDQGYELLTTAMIADRSGASIGTVYRYFPDRIAVVHALRERAVQRFRENVGDRLASRPPPDAWAVIDECVDATVEMYRREPGFRVIQFADPDRAQVDGIPGLESAVIAHRIADVLTSAFDVPEGADLLFRLDVAVELVHGLVARAFASDRAGDERYLGECRAILASYLGPILGDPQTGVAD